MQCVTFPYSGSEWPTEGLGIGNESTPIAHIHKHNCKASPGHYVQTCILQRAPSIGLCHLSDGGGREFTSYTDAKEPDSSTRLYGTHRYQTGQTHAIKVSGYWSSIVYGGSPTVPPTSAGCQHALYPLIAKKISAAIHLWQSPWLSSYRSKRACLQGVQADDHSSVYSEP